MRLVLLPVLAFTLVAASPRTEEAERLVDGGQDASAFRLLQRGADEGDLDSVEYLAWFYDTGRHVRQDKAEAARLYRRAAIAGQANAQWRLGVMLHTGEGVREDPVEALAWIRRAAAQDHPSGTASLAVMYANGRGVSVDYAQAMRYYRRAARLGSSGGFRGVGVLYRNGQGVAADRVEAGAWLIAALALRDTQSGAALDDLDLDSDERRRATTRARAILREFGRPERPEYDGPPSPVV